jgi:NAD(P)-dependent dehydrogenase (short-subunit alcohol dehydrogenase family)
MKNKIWFVTGASQGFGLSLVKQLLEKGYWVAATSRTLEGLRQALGDAEAAGTGGRLLPLEVDLTKPEAIRRSIERTVEVFGGIDVVVNNAGYGMDGTAEEVDEEKLRAIFAINVFATIEVTKFALPYFRGQRRGHFINLASVAGFVGAPGWSIYSATKSAVIAFSEVLALGVGELGIKVTVVGPSGFRTGFLSAGSLVSTESKIADYQTVAQTRERYAAMNGNQEGDPEKAAAVLIGLGENPEPPLRLWLGSNAVERAQAKIEALGRELEQWRGLSVSADY